MPSKLKFATENVGQRGPATGDIRYAFSQLATNAAGRFARSASELHSNLPGP
jgi:hypothetical protein